MKNYTKKEKAMFNKDAEPIESSATDPNFGKDMKKRKKPTKEDLIWWMWNFFWTSPFKQFKQNDPNPK